MAFASIAFCENLKELMKKPGLTLEKLSEKSVLAFLFYLGIVIRQRVTPPYLP